MNEIKELNIETIGQEELKTVQLQRGTDAKQLEATIEIINNNENAIENVKIMGTFPTKNKENNIDTNITSGNNTEKLFAKDLAENPKNEDKLVKNNANSENKKQGATPPQPKVTKPPIKRK